MNFLSNGLGGSSKGPILRLQIDSTVIQLGTSLRTFVHLLLKLSWRNYDKPGNCPEDFKASWKTALRLIFLFLVNFIFTIYILSENLLEFIVYWGTNKGLHLQIDCTPKVILRLKCLKCCRSCIISLPIDVWCFEFYPCRDIQPAWFLCNNLSLYVSN